MQLIKDVLIKIIDYSLPGQGPIDEHGGLTTFDCNKSNLEVYDYMKNVSKTLFGSNLLMDFIAQKGFGGLSDFTDFFYMYPGAAKLIDTRVIGAIYQYLGAGAKIDFAGLAAFNMDEKAGELINYSGLFHHDSVGSRLKLFFPLNPEGNRDYPTAYISGTHKLKWKTYINPVNSNGSRIPDELLKLYSDVSKNEKVVPFGTSYLFDTNGIHSGCYRPSSQPRLVVQMEFSNRKSLLVRGKVGPSQFNLHSTAYEHFSELKLLRRSNIKRQSDDNYLHIGRSNRRNILNLSDVLKESE